jgi:hypothetical protein
MTEIRINYYYSAFTRRIHHLSIVGAGRKGYIFHSPEGEWAAEAFQSLSSHIDGKIRMGTV